MSEDTLKEIASTLKEMLKWIKFSGAKEVKNVLINTLDTEQKHLIYQFSNGEKGRVEIAEMVGTSDSTVRRYWISWARLGIMEAIKVRGGERYKKIFDLEEFGIDPPQPQVATTPIVEGEQREKH